jgi:hypothetical protein
MPSVLLAEISTLPSESGLREAQTPGTFEEISVLFRMGEKETSSRLSLFFRILKPASVWKRKRGAYKKERGYIYLGQRRGRFYTISI